MPCLLWSLLLLLGIASSASAVTMEWAPIGDPGNACDSYTDPYGDPKCSGAVGYGYNIGKYEVTNAQYTEFLNAKAASDPFGLYHLSMGNPASGYPSDIGHGGVARSGVDGSYTYAPIVGRANMPVNYVSWFDALRFANWMNNGQGSADTESGAYTLLGGTPTPSNASTLTRNAGATIVLPTEDEWYKAAYYAPTSLSYFNYPTVSDTFPGCTGPTAAPNRMNCEGAASYDVTPVGSYTGSASPYGTFDQGGNVFEVMEAVDGIVFRGGEYAALREYALAPARYRYSDAGGFIEHSTFGFRLVLAPEPGTGLLVIAGLLGFAGWRKVRA